MRARTLRRCVLCALVGAALSTPACSEQPPATMFEDVERWVWRNGYEAGDWSPDYGDAPFHGIAFYSIAGWTEQNEGYRGRAREALDYNMSLFEQGLGDTLFLLRELAAILYATLGVIEYMAHSGDREPLSVVEDTIDQLDGVIGMFNDYLAADDPSVDTYGATAISSMFAMVHLQHAFLLDTDRERHHIDRGRAIAQRVSEVAWNGSFYQYDGETTEDLYLYPNVSMIIVNVRLHQLTEEQPYLDRAIECHSAIDALRRNDRPGMMSPYSAEYMGAQTNDYTTLSSTNYSIMALGLLAQVTGDEQYKREVDELIDFVEDYLWVPGDGRVYHHWMDGQIAQPGDPEYYCIGCNLHLLYVLFWVQLNLG